MFLVGLLLLLFQISQTGSVVISEFQASNDSTLTDDDGDFEDWIELYNAGDTTVDIGGLHLTDDANEPTKWTFPSGTLIDSDSFLVVFASGKDRLDGTNLHTNFKLGASGEYLGLFDAVGSTPLSQFAPAFPQQQPDQSYGLGVDDNQVFFTIPTPGAENSGPQIGGIASPVDFSVERGFFSNSFDLVLSTSQSNPSTIRYTVDGSEPTLTNGLAYFTPISVSTTTVLRAASFADRFSPSPVATHTYIFLNDVIQQPAQGPEGFPTGRLIASGPHEGEVPIDFAMDQSIVQQHSDEIFQAMQSIPTMILSAGTEEIFGDDGFYFNDDIEARMSMEVFYTDGTKHQQDTGVESHSHNRLKRALRLNFRSEYGNNVWPTNVFRSFPAARNTAADRVRRVILRSGNNRSWARSQLVEATSYTLDEFYRVTQQDMSGYSAHGTFVHLYMNGVYDGVFNLVER